MLCLNLLSSDTISTIEALVANKEDIFLSTFHLLFNDKKLEDGSRTLADLEIPNEATLQMALMINAECDDNYHNHRKIVINAPAMGLRGGGGGKKVIKTIVKSKSTEKTVDADRSVYEQAFVNALELHKETHLNFRDIIKSVSLKAA